MLSFDSQMTTNTMAFAISTPTSSLLHSSISSFSNPAISIPKTAPFQHVKGFSQLGFVQFSQWNGLKHMGISISHNSVKIEKNGKCKGKKGVYASLFGVGAPEALVIGVVALLVFGPKGLAEVARNLGKTLRAFQPTIRELQEVSREFKSTLEREIGLDDVDYAVPKRTMPTPLPEDDITKDSGTDIESVAEDSPSKSAETSWDDSVKMTEAQLRGALTQLRKEQKEEKEKEKEKEIENELVSQTPSQDIPQVLDAPQESSTATIPSQSPESNALQKDADLTVPLSPTPKPESNTQN